MSKEKKYNYIYKTLNLLNGKYYLGMHSTDNLNDGYIGSGTKLRYSINKYGKKNHKVEILEFCNSREELKKREEEIINLNEIVKINCMNLKIGGYGGFSSEEHKQKFLNEGTKNGRTACNKFLNEKYGDNFLSVISNKNWDKLKNNKDFMLEFLIKVKNGLINSGFENGTFFGLNHSDETKKLMSDVKQGHGIGETNSQYGTCWITKEGINKKIKKEDLTIWVEQGWIKGRTN